MGIWFIAAAVQFLVNELLLVGFASSLGVAALFVMLENPGPIWTARSDVLIPCPAGVFEANSSSMVHAHSMVVRATHSGVNPAKVLGYGLDSATSASIFMMIRRSAF